MNFHTDLAIERHELLHIRNSKNIKVENERINDTKITKIEVLNHIGAIEIDKPVGKYITIEIPEFSHESELMDERFTILKDAIYSFIPKKSKKFLIAGLGNENITPDALGPRTARGIFATNHITEEMAKKISFQNINSVSAFSLGVLGQTGVESGRLLLDIAKDLKPDWIIVIDALAARNQSRLGNTIQMTDTGLVPGSGVGNHRFAITKSTMNQIPVLAIGIPTVIDLDCILEKSNISVSQNEAEHMMVCPRDIDTIIHRAAKFLSFTLNCALQPTLSPEIILSMM